jgi:sporulation protein YlmC with PRC-barrel domain
MTFRSGGSLLALIVALGFSSPLAAQTSPAQQRPTTPAPAEAPKAPVAGQIVTQKEDTLLAKDLIGQSVYSSDKSKIGSISDLILSNDGKSVQGFVIGVGGFLGIGEKSVALQMDRLQMQRDADGLRLTMDVKKEELTNAPSFKTKKDMEAEKQAAERARNQPQPGATTPAKRPAN